MSSPRTVIASRYVTPLREGGSLPAIIEADDDGLYVLKFRGAGQGPKALIAELLAGEVGGSQDCPFLRLSSSISRRIWRAPNPTPKFNASSAPVVV